MDPPWLWLISPRRDTRMTAKRISSQAQAHGIALQGQGQAQSKSLVLGAGYR